MGCDYCETAKYTCLGCGSSLPSERQKEIDHLKREVDRLAEKAKAYDDLVVTAEAKVGELQRENTKLIFEAEEYQCLSMVLDDLGIPKGRGEKVFSLVGRFMEVTKAKEQAEAEVEKWKNGYNERDEQIGIQFDRAEQAEAKAEAMQKVVDAADTLINKLYESGCLDTQRLELVQEYIYVSKL